MLPDDPILDNWYHTIELGEGLVTKGLYDLRSIIECYDFPDSLAGKTCLDVATANGFFAFEMERRGAARVVAMDAPALGDLDLLPQVRSRIPSRLGEAVGPGQPQFQIAHKERRSRVEPVFCNVYDLSPETVGVFDVVFCGSLLLHLYNPLEALCCIRSVTREMAIIETWVDPELDERFPAKPWLSFGCRSAEASDLGSRGVYWRFSTRALEDMLAYAGFAETRRLKPFFLPIGAAGRAQGLTEDLPVTAFVAYPMAPREAADASDVTSGRFLIADLVAVGDNTATMVCGHVYSFQFTVTNIGDVVWFAVPNDRGEFVQLGAHLLDADAVVIEESYGRGRLLRDMRPGDVQVLDIVLRAPGSPGVYSIVFDMVLEHVCWFAQRDSRTVTLTLRVI